MVHKRIRIGQIILGMILAGYTLFCLLPVILAIIASFTAQIYIETKGVSFFPEEWSLKAYETVGKYGSQLIYSYGITIWITIAGTFWSLAIMSMFAYTLARPNFPIRGFLSIMMLITMLFHGGRAASYIINTQWYHLRDSLWVLILPGISTMHVIIFRTYIQHSIPSSLIESAKIDGAGEFRIYRQIVLPCMIPSLASVGFMLAVGHWNAWEGARLYIETYWKKPLQLLMMNIESNINYMLANANQMSADEFNYFKENTPSDSTRFAILMVVSGPILIAYPFFQKYFISGLTVGAVKG